MMKISFYSDRLCKDISNAPVYSHGHEKGQMRYNVIGYYSHFADPVIMES